VLDYYSIKIWLCQQLFWLNFKKLTELF
jgi:hypothetical protein